MLKVYNEKDHSLIEYFSHNEHDFDHLSKLSPLVSEYSKFYNKHYDLVAQIEERVTKHGNASGTNQLGQDDDLGFQNTLEQQVDGINLMQLFSLAKKYPSTTIGDREKKEKEELEGSQA